jgi:tRNA splicing ligase
MNRIELLKLMPANSICAEIGVCEGEYSQHIVDIAQPSRLFLVDIWGHISLSYHDHNMVDHSKHETRFQMVAKKFIDCPNVYLLRTLSTSLENIFPEKFFDWIYIDADHSYEGCKKD